MSLPRSLPRPLVELAARWFLAMATPTRIELVVLLQDGREATVQQLSEMVDTTPQNVSKHLNHLREAGIVKKRKDGVYARCTIADPTALSVFEQVLASLIRQLGELAQLTGEDRPSPNGGVRAGGRAYPGSRAAG